MPDDVGLVKTIPACPKEGRRPRLFWPAWVAAAALAVILSATAARMPRFPLDLAVARFVQNLDPSEHGWAKLLTDSARPPVAYGLVLVASIVAGKMAGVRAMWVPPVTYGVVLILDRVLKPWIARPRPSPDLLQVFGTSASFGCPSTFGLVYAATVGVSAWLVFQYGRGLARWTGLGFGALLLLAGAAARVVLGGHWPSDLLLSYLLGGLVVTALVRIGLGKPTGFTR